MPLIVYPKEVFPLISGLTKAFISNIPLFENTDLPAENRLSGLGFGSGPTTVKFYSSAKQKLGEGTRDTENIYTRWVTPLPAEACIRPECNECFLTSSLNPSANVNLKYCTKRCGEKNTNAYYEKNVLMGIINKTKASLDLNPEESKIKAQIDKYVNKFKTMKKFEGKSLEINGVPIWSDPKTAERCEQHTLNKPVIADTQGYIIENNEAIYILFRGTEYNSADISLDLEALDLYTFKKESNMKGAVHNGFYISHTALRNFVKESIDESLKKSPNKPIFITGHSLGGAIGHIAMYSLLTSKKVGFKANIKAIYTFGAPRVGNKEFGLDYTQKAKEFGVGIYNMANENDMVPHVPCTDYHHAGAMIFVSDSGTKNSTKAVYNPHHLSGASIFLEPNSCGYFTAIKNIFSVHSILKEHKMTTYLERLSDLREQLREQKVACANDEHASNIEKVKLPDNIKINFQSLAADLEN
jgi:hypothetical protein